MILFIMALAGFVRWQAVYKLPVDFDELVYLPAAFRYQEMIAAGDCDGGVGRNRIDFSFTLAHKVAAIHSACPATTLPLCRNRHRANWLSDLAETRGTLETWFAIYVVKSPLA